MHQTILDFLKHLENAGRTGTIEAYELALRQLDGRLSAQGIETPRATTEILKQYQVWLADEYKKEDGEPLKRSTQITRLTGVLAYYRWLEKRGLIVTNPAKRLKLPSMPRRTTPKDYLDLQEATALIQTQAKHVLSLKVGSLRWAQGYRNLALISLALASGRRRHSLLTLKLNQVDFDRAELRVDWEKGKPGRVLPVARWALDVCAIYIREARQRMLRGREDGGFVFPGTENETMSGQTFIDVIENLHSRAVAENPDLTELAAKHLTPHSMRVSFATLLFKGGCNIRSINELMLHSSLTTTARYTPIPLEDLRRVCRRAHPRA